VNFEQLEFGCWGLQIPRGNCVREILTLVRPVAKWLIARVAAAAKRYRRTPAQPEDISFLIDNLKIAFHSDGTVIENRDLGRCQRILREFFFLT
jgi:hypothetical protein